MSTSHDSRNIRSESNMVDNCFAMRQQNDNSSGSNERRRVIYFACNCVLHAVDNVAARPIFRKRIPMIPCN